MQYLGRLAALLGLITLFSAACLDASAQQQRRMRPDSLRRTTETVQYNIDHSPDTTRHGFFHPTSFHSSFHMHFEGAFGTAFSTGAAFTGIGATWVVNHRLAIGARVDALTSNASASNYIHYPDSLHVKISNWSLMLTVGYIARSQKRVSVEPQIGIGYGNTRFFDPLAGVDLTSETHHVRDVSLNYLIINPSINVIWNCSRYFRLGGVVGARLALGDDYFRLKSYRSGGPYIGVFMRFGTF